MSNPSSQALARVERLIYIGHYGDALEVVKSIEQNEKISTTKRLKCNLLKSILLNKLEQYEEGLMLAEIVLQECQKLEPSIQVLDAIISKTEALWHLERLDDCLKIIEQAERILRVLTQNQQSEINQRKASLLLHKGLVYGSRGDLNRALKYYYQSLTLSEQTKNKQAIAKVFNAIGLVYWEKGELNQALEYHQQSLKLRKEIGNQSEIGQSLNNLGVTYWQKGELDQALEYYQQCRTIYEKVRNNNATASILNNISVIYYSKGELDRAIEFQQQSLTLRKKIGNKQELAISLSNLGAFYRHKGELDQALDYYQESLPIFRDIGNNQAIARCFHNVGVTYWQKGELDRALKYYEQSLKLREKVGNKLDTAWTLFRLIAVTIDKGNLLQTEQYLQRLKLINDQDGNKLINQKYRVAEALVLKTSVRTRDRAKAEELLEQIANEEVVNHVLTVIAMLNLCELLFVELRASGDQEVLNEVEALVNRLINIAQHQKSHSLLAETYVLQARLALMKQDIQTARSLLTQAQVIADEKGLHRLAMKISSEHDALLNQLNIWEELIEQNASLAERAKFTQLEELVGRMIRERSVKMRELPPEEPMLLLILDESGLCIFSKPFTKSSFDDHLMGGFLTAIQAFSSPVF
ncbi:MAG: tetratricopeptide repeat protein, partial [Candidatus Hodarchaeota archaeon]